MLPAAPWETPTVTARSRVGHPAAPAGEAGAVDAAGEVAGELAAPAGVTVTVTVVVGAGPGLAAEPQAAASTATQLRIAPAAARRTVPADVVIAGLPRRCPSP